MEKHSQYAHFCNGRSLPWSGCSRPPIKRNPIKRRFIFRCSCGPKTSVKTEGASVSQGTLRKIIPVFSEGAADQDLIDEGRRNVLYYFESKGFYDVTVDSKVMRGDDRVDIVYQVNPGMHHRACRDYHLPAIIFLQRSISRPDAD